MLPFCEAVIITCKNKCFISLPVSNGYISDEIPSSSFQPSPIVNRAQIFSKESLSQHFLPNQYLTPLPFILSNPLRSLLYTTTAISASAPPPSTCTRTHARSHTHTHTTCLGLYPRLHSTVCLVTDILVKKMVSDSD